MFPFAYCLYLIFKKVCRTEMWVLVLYIPPGPLLNPDTKCVCVLTKHTKNNTQRLHMHGCIFMFIFMVVTERKCGSYFSPIKNTVLTVWLLYGHAENRFVEWSTLLILFKLHGSCSPLTQYIIIYYFILCLHAFLHRFLFFLSISC